VICKGQSSLEKGKAFPKGKDDSFVIRKELNYHLAQNGIDRSVTRSCDNIFQKNEASLEQKLESTARNNSFSKDDVFNYIRHLMDDYYTNKEEVNSGHPVDRFEGRFKKQNAI